MDFNPEKAFERIEEGEIFVKNLSKEELKSVILFLNSKYHNSSELVSDKYFDNLVCLYEDKFEEKLNLIGAEINNKKLKVRKIPYSLVSLDKIREEPEITRWKKDKKGDFFVQRKVDGATLFLGKNKTGEIEFYTRGGGRDGAILDLENILNLPYINIPKNVYIRGELVIHKDTFKDLKKYKGIRNVVSGFLNSENPDPELGSKLHFYAYKIYCGKDFSMIQHFEILHDWGFDIPNTIKVSQEDLNRNYLTNLFFEEKDTSPYEIDGLVIYTEDEKFSTLDEEGKNPKYSVAFKVIDKVGIEVTVVNIQWKPSGGELLIPVIEIEPVFISSEENSDKGVTLKKISGSNAKNIIDNRIGKGAVISITMNIIPVFIRTIKKSSEEDMILPEQDFEWNDTKIHFVPKDKNLPEIVAKKILLCLKAYDIKGFAGSRISEFMHETCICSVYEVYTEFIFKSIQENYSKNTTSIISALKSSFDKNENVEIFMVSTGLFKAPLGLKNIQKILIKYPNVITDMTLLEKDDVISKLLKNGFKLTSKKIYECLESFLNLYSEIVSSKFSFKSKLDTRENFIKRDNQPSLENNLLLINEIEPFVISLRIENKEGQSYCDEIVSLFSGRKVALTSKPSEVVARFLFDIKAEFTDKLESDSIVIFNNEKIIVSEELTVLYIRESKLRNFIVESMV